MIKAFSNGKHNRVRLEFPNGNSISTIWGPGSYSDNYSIDLDDNMDTTSLFNTFQESDTCEAMVDCGDKLLRRLEKRFDCVNPFGRLSITEWLYIINAIAEEKNE